MWSKAWAAVSRQPSASQYWDLQLDGNLRHRHQGVVNQAAMHGAHQANLLLLGEGNRAVHLDGEVAQAGRVLQLLRVHDDLEPAGSQISRLKVLSRIEGGARAQRSQHQLRRRHAVVSSAVVSGLVANQAVMAGMDGEFDVL